MTFFVTPSSSSISRVEGWIVAARCSIGGSGSCSNTVTDIPLRLSASAHTIPTGPAPTMTTRALAFDAAMPELCFLMISLLLHCRRKIVFDGKPAFLVRGYGPGHFLRRGAGRLDADLEELIGELWSFHGIDNRLGDHSNDFPRGFLGREYAVVGGDEWRRQGLRDGRYVRQVTRTSLAADAE